ncbi:hypothetical protein GGF37_001091 [Kickxella alabastrina]|nr:hypothetical protein GGF37_001091 [Kickxella alabastrina]
MLRLTAVIFTLIAAATANQCSGNAAICPNNQDGVSSSYLQCDNWAKQYITTPCPAGQVCYANPAAPNSVMCAPPGSGSVPGTGKCTGHTAKCANHGQSGAYYSCEPWAGQYVNNQCPAGLKCYNNDAGTGVQCY